MAGSSSGFARGYQARWTNILGQHLGAKATLSPAGLDADKLAAWTEEQKATRIDDDRVNREVFEEQVDMVFRAWADDSIDSKGRWQIPFPYDEGIDWTMTATKEIGAPGEMDDDNRIRRVSVVPAPLQKPHPPIFVSSNASRETVEYCGPRGFIPAYFTKIEKAEAHAKAYVEAARLGQPGVPVRPEPGHRPLGQHRPVDGAGPPQRRGLGRRHLPRPLRRHHADGLGRRPTPSTPCWPAACGPSAHPSRSATTTSRSGSGCPRST